MSLFNKAFTPNDLDPDGFRDFVLHIMSDYRVDLSQPNAWSQVCRADGSGVPHYHLGRELAPKVGALGATLYANLLSKIVRTFLLHGQEIDPQRSYSVRSRVSATGGE